MTLIVALDPPLEEDPIKWSIGIIEKTREYVSGFKIGLPMLLRTGVDAVKQLTAVTGGSSVIADLKLADIGFVMSLSAAALARAGVRGVIAHSFVGVRDALDILKRTCEREGMDLILVVAMSHRGAEEVMTPVMDKLLGIAKEVAPWGVVLPATKPRLIQRGRRILGEHIKILAPGVGAQGARPGSALCAGADYEIVGRAITRAPDPADAVLRIRKEQMEVVKTC